MSKAVDKFEAEFHRRLLVEVAEDLQRRDAELELRDLRLLELERELSEVRAKSAELTRKAERRDLLARLEHELLELRNAELVREAETAKRVLGELRARNAEREAKEARAVRAAEVHAAELARVMRAAEEARAVRAAEEDERAARQEKLECDYWAELHKKAAEITAERKRRLADSIWKSRQPKI